MLSTLSSNVILAKARAMYGHRLTESDYSALLKCSTVGEVAAYLKKNTYYAPELSTVNEMTVHRGYLEALLRRKIFDDYASLCRYEITVGEHFSDYIIEKGEIEQLLTCLRLLNVGRSQEYLLTLPIFFTKYMSFDLYELAKVKNYDEFLQVLAHTPYRKILESFRPQPENGMQLDFTAVENALFSHLYKKVFSIIDQHAHGGPQQELRELFGSYIDMENISRIIRLKTYYNAGPDYIRSVILPFSYHISDKLLERLLQAKDADAVIREFNRSVYGKAFAKYEGHTADEVAVHAKFDRCVRKLRFSVYPSVVMLTYLFLAEIELDNITNIIEGIRYQLSPKDISRLLIGYKNSEKG